MKSMFFQLACAAAISAMLVIAPAHAGADLNRSEVSTLVTSAGASMLVSAPLLLVASVADKSSTAAGERQARRVSAGPLPDMKVEAITQDADGGRSARTIPPGTSCSGRRWRLHRVRRVRVGWCGLKMVRC
jgi:hypothetical protein